MGTDPELLKLVLQGGSFALLAVCFIWLLVWGVPMLRDDRKHTMDTHVKTITALVDGFREEKREQRQHDADEGRKLAEVIRQQNEALKELTKGMILLIDRVQGCPHNTAHQSRRPPPGGID